MDDYMYPYKMGIDGVRSNDDQYWRIHRIYLIIGYAQAIADLNDNEDFYKKIDSIYDHKGNLTIAWKKEPSKKEKEYLQKAWESIVTDYEGNPIDHFVI